MMLFRILSLFGLAVVPLAAEVSLSMLRPQAPVLRRQIINPALGFTLTPAGGDPRPTLQSVEISLAGSTHPKEIVTVRLVRGSQDPRGSLGPILASFTTTGDRLLCATDIPLEPGPNTFWISPALDDEADIDGRISITLAAVRVGGVKLSPEAGAASATQRIGVAIRKQGDDQSHSYRIPALAMTNAGSVLAAYDIRRDHCGDLPARIDVGVSRSTNGGQSWEPMRIAMHAGSMDADYRSDGIGDPALLVDRTTGRIWLSALWSHGQRGWKDSGPGMSPSETGQLLLTHSDDDGKTWAPLRNITAMVKQPEWRLCFAAPGAGIFMRDGTLVFAAMFRAADGGDTMGKPFATILSSRDRGVTWQIGTGARIDTTEAQVAELDDGTLVLNCRDDRGGTRSVLVTRDLGKTWQPHPTDRSTFVDPTCMASLLRWDHPRFGTFFAFSNPASATGRNDMTIKVSKDQTRTWPEKWHLRYDSRFGSGYSCIAPAGPEHLGVLYEGRCELYYIRIPLAEVLAP